MRTRARRYSFPVSFVNRETRRTNRSQPGALANLVSRESRKWISAPRGRHVVCQPIWRAARTSRSADSAADGGGSALHPSMGRVVSVESRVKERVNVLTRYPNQTRFAKSFATVIHFSLSLLLPLFFFRSFVSSFWLSAAVSTSILRVRRVYALPASVRKGSERKTVRQLLSDSSRK